MLCPNAHELLQTQLDGIPASPDDAAALDAHLRTCADCRQLSAGLVVLGRTLPQLQAPAVSFTLTRSLVEQLQAQARRDRRLARLRWVGGFAAAASVLVALGLGVRYWPATGPQPVGTEPVAVVPPRTEPHVPTEHVNLREAVAEAGGAVAALTTKTADSTVGQSRLLIPAVVNPMVPPVEIDPPLEPAGKHLADAGEGVKEGFQPVANSARRAMNLFLRELPMDPVPQPGS